MEQANLGTPAIIDLQLRAEKLRSELLPILVGTVFHVSSLRAFASIQRDGMIRQNKAGVLGDSFPQSRDSYGRRNGYVSLFDLRTVPEGELEWVLTKLFFLNPQHTANHPVFLIVHPDAYGEIIPWTHAGPAEMLVPHAEAWYPTDLSLQMVERILRVVVIRREESEFLDAFRKTT